jgi:RNA-directed DNA polymerase
MTGCAGAAATGAVEVNGPEDGFPDWDQVDWGQAEENVRRLRQRIFAASKAGDLKKVRNLQKLMLRSRSSALVSVRRVTEINAGRRTAGVDVLGAIQGERRLRGGVVACERGFRGGSGCGLEACDDTVSVSE